MESDNNHDGTTQLSYKYILFSFTPSLGSPFCQKIQPIQFIINSDVQ